MSVDLGRLLIASGAVSQAEVEAALFMAVLRGISFPRALIDRAAITERALEGELERRGGLAMRQVIGSRELFGRLPRAMCRRLAAVPTRIDPGTQTVDIAAVDPLDAHIPAEFGFHLGHPVRVLRAPVVAVEEAIRALELDDRALADDPRARARRATPAFPHGAPQSTIPPPPVDEVPIPLVRRAGVAAAADPATRRGLRSDAGNDAGPRASRSPVFGASPVAAPPPVVTTAPDDEPVLPLRHTKPEPSTRRDGPDRGAAAPPQGAAAGGRGVPGSTPPTDRSAAAPQQRPPVLREPSVPPPAISFPSSPPAPAEEADASAEAAHGAWAEAHAAYGIGAAIEAGVPRAALRAPATPAPDPPRPDSTPPTMRQGRMHIDREGPPAVAAPTPARPVLRVDIPGPRAAQLADTAEPLAAAHPGAPPEPNEGDAPPGEDAGPSDERDGPPAEGEFDEQDEALDEGPPPLPFVDPTDILDAIYAARARDDVVRLALRGLRLIARRVAVFVAKQGAFRGFACNVEFGDEGELRELALPLDQPSILATAAATGVYLGPVPGTLAHASLLDVMENPSLDVAAVAVKVAGRPAMILVADQLGDTMTGTRRMDELARAVGDALTRMLVARR